MNHKKLAIFEGAMCCDSGVCGAAPDINLVGFADTLKKLKQDYPGIEILRANMSSGLEVFRKNMDILMMIKSKGVGILPLVMIDDEIYSQQRYPKYEELVTALNA
ncbi:MAG: arsenic metallochaperone ArsD family protein [Dehalococcoidia bacterium]|nr:arsenic metallochaperone ArsD family protein [Dehalococcoidia bacterium]